MEDITLPLYNDVFNHIIFSGHHFYMATVIMFLSRNIYWKLSLNETTLHFSREITVFIINYEYLQSIDLPPLISHDNNHLHICQNESNLFYIFLRWILTFRLQNENLSLKSKLYLFLSFSSVAPKIYNWWC